MASVLTRLHRISGTHMFVVVTNMEKKTGRKTGSKSQNTKNVNCLEESNKAKFVRVWLSVPCNFLVFWGNWKSQTQYPVYEVIIFLFQPPQSNNSSLCWTNSPAAEAVGCLAKRTALDSRRHLLTEGVGTCGLLFISIWQLYIHLLYFFEYLYICCTYMLLATVRWIVNLVTWDYVAIFVKVDLIEKCRGLETYLGKWNFHLTR